MTQYNNIPQGYKQTELGIIPQEWEVKRLGNIAKCFSGGTPKSESEEMYGGTIPFIRSGEIHSNKTALFLTDDGLRKSSAKMVDVGDLIFALYGANSGDCAISQINGAINQAILCIRSSSVINPFLHPYLELQKDRYIAKYLQGGQGNLSGEIVCSYTISVPPMEEQRKIAEILGVWDEAIEKQSRLIERLEVCKRALMQRLLSGRTRLPGFTTPWQKIKLGEIFRERNETRCEYLPLLSITADKGVILQSESDKKDTSNEDKSKYKRICPNDIGYNTMRMWQGRSALSSLEGIISPAYTIVTPKVDVEMMFVSELIKQPRVVYDFWTHSQGLVGDTLNCKFHDFSQVKVAIPSLPEQMAIAEVLTTADNEIAIHRKKLDALRLQKRGLMQQLLTGITRVKIQETLKL